MDVKNTTVGNFTGGYGAMQTDFAPTLAFTDTPKP